MKTLDRIKKSVNKLCILYKDIPSTHNSIWRWKVYRSSCGTYFTFKIDDLEIKRTHLGANIIFETKSLYFLDELDKLIEYFFIESKTLRKKELTVKEIECKLWLEEWVLCIKEEDNWIPF